MKKFQEIGICCIGIFSLLFAACSTSEHTIDRDLSPAVLFEKGKAEFEEENWLRAQQYFDIIRLQYPASEYADDAQYYLAETYFAQKEYILAAYNYNMVVRSYPGSQWAKDAAFKVGLCYYSLSPEYYRDQRYTYQAIDAFREFLTFYPDDPFADSARTYIQQLRTKLAEKDYRAAELYLKLYDTTAALLYFDEVIQRFPDTHFALLAAQQTLEIYARRGDYGSAFEKLRTYQRIFPDTTTFGPVTELILQWRNKKKRAQ